MWLEVIQSLSERTNEQPVTARFFVSSLLPFLGDFQTDVTCPVAGSGFTGLVIASLFGANGLCSAFWGQMISRRRATRRAVFCLASLLLALFLVLKIFWHVPTNYRLPAGSMKWEMISEPKPLDVFVIFLLAVIFAAGDSFFEAGPPMTLQSFYAGSSCLMPAMANYKLWQSLGFAIQFFIAIPLKDFPVLRGGKQSLGRSCTLESGSRNK